MQVDLTKYPTLEKRFWAKVQKTEHCWLWLGAKDRNGFGNIAGGQKGSPTFKAHRVAYELLIGEVPDGLLVLHRCGNLSCVNPSHLFVGTYSDSPSRIPEAVSDRFWRNVQKREDDSCWLWMGTKRPTGYGCINIEGKMVDTHRVAYQLVYGSIPAGLFVCHKCDVRLCVRPDHLFLETNAGNLRDMVQKGRSLRGDSHPTRTGKQQPPRGKRSGTAKLSEKDVREIRSRYSSGAISQQSLAREYGVGRTQIGRIIHRKRWGHLD